MKLKAAPPILRLMAPVHGYAPGDTAAANRQRIVFEPHRAWYNTAEWKRLRIATFTRDLFVCALCKRIEGKSAWLVCDHVEPHKGDRAKFFDPANLQTLCKPCHDSEKQKQERAAGLR
ncbi:MAG: HNH endonuclease [Aestuariivirga sp.]